MIAPCQDWSDTVYDCLVVLLLSFSILVVTYSHSVQRLPQRAGITDMSKVMHWACMESPSCRIWHMQGRGPSVHCYNWRQVALPVAGRLPPDYLHVKHEAVAAPCPLSAPLVHTGIWCCMDVVHSVVPILGLCRHGRHAHPRAQPGSRLGLGKSGAGGSGVACSAGLGF